MPDYHTYYLVSNVNFSCNMSIKSNGLWGTIQGTQTRTNLKEFISKIGLSGNRTWIEFVKYLFLVYSTVAIASNVILLITKCVVWFPCLES